MAFVAKPAGVVVVVVAGQRSHPLAQQATAEGRRWRTGWWSSRSSSSSSSAPARHHRRWAPSMMVVSRGFGTQQEQQLPAKKASGGGSKKKKRSAGGKRRKNGAAKDKARGLGGHDDGDAEGDGEGEHEVPDEILAKIAVAKRMEPGSRVHLDITVPQELVQLIYGKVLRLLSKRTDLDGFKKGDPNLPEKLLINYHGEDNVKEHVVENLLRQTMPGALSGVAEKAIDGSENLLTTKEDLIASLNPSREWKYSMTVDISPEVKFSSEGAYKGLKLAHIPQASKEEIQLAVEELIRARRKEIGTLQESLTGIGIQADSHCILDITGRHLSASGEVGDPILPVCQEDVSLDMQQAENILPGFAHHVAGCKKGETKTFDLNFPSDWPSEGLRGQRARFQVDVKKVMYRELPPENDELAPQIRPSCTTVEQLRQQLYEEEEARLTSERQKKMDESVLQALGDVMDTEVPRFLVESQGRELYSQKLLEMEAQGTITPDAIKQLTQPNLVDRYINSQRQPIEAMILRSMAINRIKELENIEASEEEVEAETKMAVAALQAGEVEYDEESVRERSRELLESAKVIRFISDAAVWA